MRLTARTRLTLLFSTLIALSGAVLTVIVIVLTFTPNQTRVEPKTVEKTQIVQLGVDMKAQARQELLDRLMLGAGIGIGVLTVASAGLGWLLAGRVLRPVHVVSGTARRLSQQNLHERIPVSGPQDEMRELAETFNDMLARLQRSFDAQSHFAANAAHELRGPMTTQRTLVEVAAGAPDAPPSLRELAGSLAPVLERQERLVNGLLELAWSEHGMTTIETVRVDSLVRAPGASLSLAPLTVSGDPTLLDLMVDNLVRNAFTHGKEVWISTTSDTLTVENTGQEVSAARLATLTEPFRRGSQDRLNGNGTGLGLAIVSAVVRAHNASLDLTPRPAGGIRATVRFPAGTMR